jgi:myotubularin-related protein 10/11/12
LLRDLELFAQCYYRWMPILEIRNGGFVQIDLYNRMILSNIHKLQRSLDMGTVNDDESTANGQQRQRVPVVNSFFPFSITDADDDYSNLNDILIFSSDVLTEGSVFELE